MKSIIFNQHQVNHALKNEEGVFRVVIKNPNNCHISYRDGEKGIGAYFTIEGFRAENGFKKSRFKVGETIFAKETYEEWDDGLVYKADNQPCNIVCKWKSPVHMKQEHSRLTLHIKDIRVERLQDISEEDCSKEGIGYTGGWNGEDYDDGEFYFGKLTESENGMNWKNEMFDFAEDAFEELWNSTHKKPEEKWEANPWVFRYGYEVEND